jgi:hypothetical protein
MTLEQILDNGYVVAADDWMNVIVVWNGSATFNVWSEADVNAYRNVECFTKQVSNALEAQRHARAWIQNVYDEMEGFYEAA